MSEKEQERIENAQRADTHKVLTLPNLLSFFRILLIPVIIVLYYHAQYVWAFALLLLSGATDVVLRQDGSAILLSDGHGEICRP